MTGVCNWRYGAKISSTADLEAPKDIFLAPLQSTAIPATQTIAAARIGMAWLRREAR